MSLISDPERDTELNTWLSLNTDVSGGGANNQSLLGSWLIHGNRSPALEFPPFLKASAYDSSVSQLAFLIIWRDASRDQYKSHSENKTPQIVLTRALCRLFLFLCSCASGIMGNDSGQALSAERDSAPILITSAFLSILSAFDSVGKGKKQQTTKNSFTSPCAITRHWQLL